MALAPLKALTGNTVTILEGVHEDLIRQSEQLRILKNYTKLESTITKTEIINLINAMEGNDE